MYEFHGWACVRYHTHDTDETKQRAAWDRVVERLRALEARTGIAASAGFLSDEVIVWHGLQSQRGDAWPVELLRLIGEEAPGSYGILYARDYEDPDPEAANAFRVYALRRGVLEEETDPFLSPFVPRCEDPYDPSRPEA
ncbi:MAG TPA: Imm7 family immunity protein [Sandaracinaceae bacterium LLY-WYZ-13_1]|nr:Imm7 family immunity protein [Sandaracinaceae bacterium LLY-WYZ-13_1]